jgi:hypothetical protein
MTFAANAKTRRSVDDRAAGVIPLQCCDVISNPSRRDPVGM